MPATFDDLQTRPEDFPVECARHRQRCDGVVFAPKDQRGNPKPVELPVELLPWISEGFQHAADGVTVASLEVQRVSEINELLSHHPLVVEHAFERVAQVGASGNFQVDRNWARAIVDARCIIQDELFDLFREPQGERGDDPAAERMTEEMRACNSDVGEESIEHLDKPGDAVID